MVVYAHDRLHRRLDELERFIDLADRHGTALATVSGDVDLATPAGRLVARLLGAVARGEVETKGARQRRANLQRAQSGRTPFSRRPYGYTDDGNRIVPAEAKVIRTAARDVLAGATLAETVAGLNASGAVTSTGSRWTVTTLRRSLLSPRYAGLATYRGQVTGAGAWPAILDEATHHALTAKLRDARRRTAPSNVRRYLLSGVLFCGRCGERMFASPMGVPGRYVMVYKCRRSAHLTRRLDLVDEVVEAAVIGRLSRADAAGLLIDDGSDQAEELRAEAIALRGQLDETASMFAEGAITAGQLRTITGRVRERLTDVERQQSTRGRGDLLADLVSAGDVAAVWRRLSLGRKRAVIDLLMAVTILPSGKGVRFSAEQVQIEWQGGAG